MSKSTEKCPEQISTDGWHHHPCGRPVKRDGLCGIHANAADKRKANHEKRQSEWAASDQAKVVAERRIAQLADLVGQPIGATPARNETGGYTGGVKMSPATTDILLSLLTERVNG